MDPKQEDERFFEALESAYNTIDNHLHPEEQTHVFSTPSPPSFNLNLPDVSEPYYTGSVLTPVNDQPSESGDIPNNMRGFQEPTHSEGKIAIPTFREIVSRAVQLSRNAMGLAVNTAVYRSSYSSSSSSSGSTLTIDPLALSQHGHALEAVDGGAADVTDPSAVDVELISQLIATGEGSRYADVEVLLGCYRLIAKIERQISAEEGREGETP